MRITKAVIPAAGLGTRMLPATKTIPKEMLPIVDKPLIQYIVEEAVASGIEDILIVTSRAKSAMEDYFDYHPELEDRLLKTGKHDEVTLVRGAADLANIQFVRQKETLGLGHAIWRAKSFVGQEHFAVLLGDDIMHADIPVTRQLIEVAQACGTSVVGVQPVSMEDIPKYSNLKVQHMVDRIYDVEQIVEKPKPERAYSKYAILGRYILSPAIFDILENQPAGYGREIQLTDGINTLCAQKRVLAVDFEGKRYDAGNLKGYMEAIIDHALRHAEIGAWLRSFLIDKVNGF